ncbi:MAG: GDSL-type esterase/lipase family protein [Deltaproteobacteria bacterium]|jgi:lysophospholipase L1-like esterase|nr:GDSL-type esterase/lipase family protein [Deltaproteobacteria bacterium]
MSTDLTDQMVLLGDSLTEYWNWSEVTSKLKVINQGIGGDTSMGLLSRVSYAADLRPKIISLQVGINDLSQGLEPSEIAENHLLIWKEINQKTPQSHLIVNSLMPLRREKLDWATDTLHNHKVRQTNQLLKANYQKVKNGLVDQLRFEKGLSWLDLYSLCADPEGELPAHMTDDGVHLTWSAYWTWTEALKRHLALIMDWA